MAKAKDRKRQKYISGLQEDDNYVDLFVILVNYSILQIPDSLEDLLNLTIQELEQEITRLENEIANNSIMVKTTKRKTRVSRVKKWKPTHPWFKKTAESIAKKEWISKKRAWAILASSTRKAGAKAKRINPKLKKVRMSKKTTKKK